MKLVASLTTAAVLASSLSTTAGAANVRSVRLGARVDAVSAANAWAATATLGSHLANAIDLGAVPAAMPMKVALSLTPRDAAGAKSYVEHEYTAGDALYHSFVTPAQFASAFGPTAAEASAASSYLASRGFRNVTVSSSRNLVTGEATASMVDSAFHTSIHGFSQRGVPVFANVTAAEVPAVLRTSVQSVLGLNDVAAHLDTAFQGPHASHTDTASAQTCQVASPKGENLCVTREFDSDDMRQVYSEGTSATGVDTTLAIMSIGDLSGVIKDLRLNEKYNKIPVVPVKVVPVDYQSKEEYGSVEFDMDSQMSTGIAEDVHELMFYNMGELYESEIAQAFDRFASDDKAQVASASFGECELQAEDDGGMIAEDFMLLQAVAQGQTLFSSAGDAGSTCGFTIATNGTVPGDGPPQVEYPASSPWVMGAGGTTLFANLTGGYGDEISWDNGGGGISIFEGPAFWTAGVSPGIVPVYSGLGGPGIAPVLGYNSGRTVPDVAMDADANVSAALFYQGGTLGTNGGTSLASPLAAGVFTRLQSKEKNKLGNAGPALYASYLKAGGGLGKVKTPGAKSITSAIGGMNDILVGANGAYTALPGYDMTTGMGSFNITRLLGSFK